MARSICESFQHTARRLLDLGLGYLSLDRAASTLSTGERQRVQLARAVRNRTTGVLYVLDEPSIGLHPANVDGLLGVMRDLLADGNSVVMVDHDARILAEADHLIELGPGAGADGGHVICQGTVAERGGGPGLAGSGRFLTGENGTWGPGHARQPMRCSTSARHLDLETGALHTVRPLSVEAPPRQARGGDGRLGVGQDHACAGDASCPALVAAACRRAAARARALGRGGGRAARQPHRRHADRRQRALYRGHLRRRP